MKKRIFKYVLIGLLLLIWNIIVTEFNCDEIWDYGFVYSFTKGFLPYKDFSTIIPPFYTFLYSVPIFIFGHNILVWHIFNVFVLLFMFYYLEKLIGNKAYLFLAVTLIIHRTLAPSYNLLLLTLFILLIYLEKNKKNDYLIGFVLALCLLTKQTVGFMLLLPSFYYLKNEKEKIFKRIIGFIGPCLLFLIYLLITNTFMSFLDQCLFGLFDFGAKNKFFYYPAVILFIFMIIHMIYNLYKKHSDINIYYILAFFTIAIPLFDGFHVFYAFLVYLLYLLMNNDDKVIFNYKMLFYGSYIGISFLALSMNKNIIWPNNIHNFEYRLINSEFVAFTDQFNKYMSQHKDKHFILFMVEGYYFRILNEDRIYNYDMNLYGNHGYNGSKKLLNMIIKDSNNALIVIDPREVVENPQSDKEVIQYIMVNGELVDKVGPLEIYSLDDNGEDYE